VTPLPNHFLHVSTEPSAPGCKDESAAFAAIVDNSDPKNPRLVSYYPRPRPPDGSSYASFCDKGGRFGPHNVNAEIHSADAQAPGELIFMTYFTAGLRVFDISDPNVPFETGWFLPDIGPWSEGFRGPEDVLVDTRGVIYTSMAGARECGSEVRRPAGRIIKSPQHAATTQTGGETALRGRRTSRRPRARERPIQVAGQPESKATQRPDLGNGQFLNPILAGDFPDPVLKTATRTLTLDRSMLTRPAHLAFARSRELAPPRSGTRETIWHTSRSTCSDRRRYIYPVHGAPWFRLKSSPNIYAIAASMQGPWVRRSSWASRV
jgi:hypothetical protein